LWNAEIIARGRSFFQSIADILYIQLMNLAGLDLNLLVALDALLREANVSRAAMRIGLSQPAASHALQRLREVLGDPLLVRTGARMELTPRAQALRGPLAQALDQVRGLFIPDDFDAASSERQFRLMMPDLAVELLVPPLMEKIARLAPNVRLDIVPWRGPAIFSAEFARTIDLVISIGDAFRGFHRQLLYTDRDALAVRRGHPVGRKLARREAFLKAAHVAVVIRGQNEDLIGGWLRAKGIERRIALVVPGYLEALHVVAGTDLIAFVPGRLIAALAEPLSLKAVTPPLDPGIDEQFMFHPTRAQFDPGSIWLRNLMLQTGRELDRPKRKTALSQIPPGATKNPSGPSQGVPARRRRR
jgi:DNA-binding transcriptional LysR family regulator